MRMKTCLPLVLLFAAPGLAQAVDCSAAFAKRSEPLQPTLLAPVASELVLPTSPLGASGGVLSTAYDEAQSVDQVLLRIHTESCTNVASAVPATGGVNPNDPAAYKPRTQYDNAPWRFNMTQDGKRMTADEFSAWMESRGVRVVKARGATTTAAPPTAPGQTSAAAAQGGEPASSAAPTPEAKPY